MDILQKTIDFVKAELNNAEGGHDWWHCYRVWKTAKTIAIKENYPDIQTIELAALLHDIADSKFNDGDETIGPKKARAFLESLGLEERRLNDIVAVIENISFKGGNFEPNYHSKALDIVQDADRLDAMGAIGIARAFNYGGYKNRALYHPDIKPDMNLSKEAYKKSTAPTINHFYEKLLRLKDRMNTHTAQILAEERHRFMQAYLQQFYREWDGVLDAVTTNHN